MSSIDRAGRKFEVRSETLHWTARGFGLGIGVLGATAIIWVAVTAAPVLLLVFVAVLLASALEPLVAWTRSILPLGRGATILVVYAAFFSVVVVLALVIVPVAYVQLGELGSRVPALLDRAQTWAEGVSPDGLRSSLLALVGAARDALSASRPPDPQTVVQAGLTLAEAVTGLATLLAIVFFWLVDHARLQRYVLAFLPTYRRSGAREAWNEIETRLGLWVRGQLILMGAIGVTTATAYSLLGVPLALLLGLLAALGEAIPLVGPLLGAIPALIVAATVSVELAAAVAVVYVILQFVESNVLGPIVMRNTIGLSPFMVIVSLLMGAAVGGIVGAFVAVPAVAALEVVLERLQARDEPVAPSTASETPAPDVTEEQRSSLPDARAHARGQGSSSKRRVRSPIGSSAEKEPAPGNRKAASRTSPPGSGAQRQRRSLLAKPATEAEAESN